MTSSKRQREMARRRAERQAIRRAEFARKQRRRSLVSWSVALAVLALAIAVPVYRTVTKDDNETASDSPTPTATASADPLASESPTAQPVDARPVACAAEAPPAIKPQTFKDAPPMTIDPAKKYVATIKTSCGEVVAELLADKAPTIVNSFAFLASKQYFDGSRCHRAIDEGSFILQCGDPTASGSGGPGYQLKDENLPTKAKPPYPAGTLAMANSGPNTNGSQFFILVKESGFPPNYAVFGKVTKGLDVLEKLLAVGQDNSSQAGGGEPNQRIFIESFTVTAG